MTPRRPIRGRLWRPARASAPAEEEVIEIDPAELNGMFSAPAWLRDLGFSGWLLVGVAAALVGVIFLLAQTQTIVMPVVTAAIIASVTVPMVDWLKRHGLPRGAGAVLVFLGIVLIGIGVGVIVMGGIASQADSLSHRLHSGADEIQSWLQGLGVDSSTAGDANEEASASISAGFRALTDGLLGGVDKLASLAVFLSFAAISLFFMLKDAPTLGRFVERHLGMPVPLARTVLAQVTRSLRGYFVGVTIVAAWSAVLVGAGALLLGVPLPGTIAVVTFLGGYVPYLGAWAAGAFAVLIALGGQGPEAALAIAAIVLLANGILQQLVQPIAYGAALDLHPLAVLIATIAGGCLFGTIGLILAAPLLSAAVRISAELTSSGSSSAARAEPRPSVAETAAD
jgi:putative heme transporter